MRNLYFFVVLFLFSTAVQAQDFYDMGVREIKLEFPDENWSKKMKALKEREPERRILANVIVDGVRYDSVGVRYKGNSSYNAVSKAEKRKLPLNIKLDYMRKGQKLPNGCTSLKLSNAFRDPSFVREPLSYEIISKYMPAPRCNFARVSINGKYMGAYVNTESIDDVFLARHFGSKQKALFKCDPDDWTALKQEAGCTLSKEASLKDIGATPTCYQALYELNGPADAYKNLISLIKMLDKKSPELEKVLDIDQTLWMLAFNNTFVSLDSYNGYLSHNYYMYLDSFGVFHPLLWDMNMSMGGFRFNGSGTMTKNELINYDPLTHLENTNRPLISNLLVDGYNRKLYFHHIRTMLEDFVSSKRYFTRAQELQGIIGLAVKEDEERLYPIETFAENLNATSVIGKSEIVGLSELMESRLSYLRDQAPVRVPPPTFSANNMVAQGENILFTAKTTDVERVMLAYRQARPQLFVRKIMNDEGKDGDATAGDGVYSVLVPKADVQEYYFIAESDQAIGTHPARASMDYLKVR